jgi:hypothetical protein
VLISVLVGVDELPPPIGVVAIVYVFQSRLTRLIASRIPMMAGIPNRTAPPELEKPEITLRIKKIKDATNRYCVDPLGLRRALLAG